MNVFKSHVARIAALGSLVLLLPACASLQTPAYEPSYDNVAALKSSGAQAVGVQNFTGGPEKISIRGANSVAAPGGFASYIGTALRDEIQRANLLAPNSPLQIKGTLIATDIDAGMGTGHTTASVDFVVEKAGVQRYHRQLDVQTDWESSFVGAIAIPRAAETYPKVVDQLLKTLYADPNFIAALK